VQVLCNSIDSDNARVSDRSNDHDLAYACDNANDRTRRVMCYTTPTTASPRTRPHGCTGKCKRP
jgi:hypothetical protein